MKMTKLIPPTEMSPQQRAAEITVILAAALMRSQLANKLPERHLGLGFLPEQSVHTNLSQ
ncbi:hypothetical protein ACFQNF_19700 [Iodobacter arcticus]|uniref:Uncharacterized protein n=1 Tax=Iodobacter arcticus TaxID=590593 RepID=A0ABW2R2E6_9NEIS